MSLGSGLGVCVGLRFRVWVRQRLCAWVSVMVRVTY